MWHHDILEGCSRCGDVRAKMSEPLECEDGPLHFPWLYMSGEHYIRQINQIGYPWADWAQPPSTEQERIELGFKVAQELGWPAWKPLPQGWIEAWLELDNFVGGDNLREFDRVMAKLIDV